MKSEKRTPTSTNVVHQTYADAPHAVAAMLEWFAGFTSAIADLADVKVERFTLRGDTSYTGPSGGVLVVWVGGRQGAVATFIRVDALATALTITETL